MEVIIGLIFLVFVTILVLDSTGKERELREEPSVFMNLDDVKIQASLSKSVEDLYERNRIAIYNLSQVYPGESYQRELNFILETNENIKSFALRKPSAVIGEEFDLLYDNMHLRLNISRAKFLMVTGA